MSRPFPFPFLLSLIIPLPLPFFVLSPFLGSVVLFHFSCSSPHFWRISDLPPNYHFSLVWSVSFLPFSIGWLVDWLIASFSLRSDNSIQASCDMCYRNALGLILTLHGSSESFPFHQINDDSDNRRKRIQSTLNTQQQIAGNGGREIPGILNKYPCSWLWPVIDATALPWDEPCNEKVNFLGSCTLEHTQTKGSLSCTPPFFFLSLSRN